MMGEGLATTSKLQGVTLIRSSTPSYVGLSFVLGSAPSKELPKPDKCTILVYSFFPPSSSGYLDILQVRINVTFSLKTNKILKFILAKIITKAKKN